MMRPSPSHGRAVPVVCSYPPSAGARQYSCGCARIQACRTPASRRASGSASGGGRGSLRHSCGRALAMQLLPAAAAAEEEEEEEEEEGARQGQARLWAGRPLGRTGAQAAVLPHAQTCGPASPQAAGHVAAADTN
jgi:hypothetical protein